MFTREQKIEHYMGVANGMIPTKSNSKYSDAEQRSYARDQLAKLCGKNTSVPAKSSSSKYTPEQRAAYGAGVAFGAAKVGMRVPVKPENRSAFRKGMDRGKQMGRTPRTGY